jgi:hypothetical protein
VRLQKIRPGLWRWTALHPEWTPEDEWGEEVGCLYQETSDAITLIDPLVPPEEPARFLEALDRDVHRAGRPVSSVTHPHSLQRSTVPGPISQCRGP